MKRFLLIIVMALTTTLVSAQNESKYSITTQILLNELAADPVEEQQNLSNHQLNEATLGLKRVDEYMGSIRLVEAPHEQDGQQVVSCYLKLKDVNNLTELENLGVEILSTLNDVLVTALVPTDKFEEIAAIDNVVKIKVSDLKHPLTNKAREYTNVDDVLTLSADAISAGITTKYDGSGVLLGIIDTGIDFNHIAFKDASGNSRIAQAYVYNGSSATTYTGSQITSTLTDDDTADHGTHTCSTAGGSSVIVNGTTVTVTDDHATATYGGMAPGATLYLAGIKDLSSTYLDNAINNIITYANNNNMPVVVSNSWGSQLGPHDGTGDEADVYNSYFGDSHPNRVALFAASNDGGKSKDDEGGGYHLVGTASSSSPLRSILRSNTYTDTDAGYYYYGIMANAWARSSSVSSMTCKIYVLDSSTGAVKTSVTVNPSTNGTSVSGLSTYFQGSLYAFKDYTSSDKTQIVLYTSGLTSRSTSKTTKDGSTYYKSAYTLAVEFAPSSGSCVIDAWGGGYCYFTNHLTTSGYTWTAGTDDGCYSDEATIENVIPVGAYVSKTDWTDYNGTNQSMSDEYTLGDIAYFSSWGTATNNPTGKIIPWISAPGARLAAGVNHNHTSSVDSYSYYDSNYNSDLVVNSSSNPYAMMEGTSMATPTAAGIVALWLQASMDENAQHKNLTVNDVKTIMKETAITDAFTTTGANKDHFGNGKIDALAGVKYILGASDGPTITASPATVSFGQDGYATRTYTSTVTVKGFNLEGNITATLSGSNTYSIDKSSITQTNGNAEDVITITWTPATAGTYEATLTLSSTNADAVTVNISGTALAATPTITLSDDNIVLSTDLSSSVSKTFTVTGQFLSDDISLALTDENNVFNLSTTSISASASENGVEVTVTFQASTEDIYTGLITVSSTGAETKTISLTGYANDGGSASDNYLNLKKYQSMEEAGWSTSDVPNLYFYDEYSDADCAWVTLPVYGAYKADSQQNWITSSVTSTTATTWTNTPSATSPFHGSSPYFVNNTAYSIYYSGSLGKYTSQSVTFYVTNCTAVMAMGHNETANGNNTYPSTLTIYECTENSDGTLTAVSNASYTQNYSTKNSDFTLKQTGLDETKIYKVVLSATKAKLYEIAFQTPMAATPVITASPASLSMATNAGGSTSATTTISGTNLKGAISATLNDANGVFSIDTQSITTSEATSGKVMTVTFAPTSAGTFTGSITLTSTEATAVTISLTGTATEPELTASPMEVTLSTVVDSSVTGTFDVSGSNLNGDVTLTLNDANNVFSLSTSTISRTDAENGATVTVTFVPTTDGTFNAAVILSSDGVEDVEVTLTGNSTKGYEDITISRYGVATFYTDIPLAIPYDTYEDLLGVYYAKGYDGDDSQAGEVKLVRLNSYIPANTGVIVQGNSGTFRFPNAEDATIPALKYDNILQGSLTEQNTSDISGTIMTLGLGSNGYIGFYKYTGTTLAAKKVYIVIPDDQVKNFNTLSLSFEGSMDDVTGIYDIQSDAADAWYTVQGLRLNGKPTEKGIYIHGGKTVLVK